MFIYILTLNLANYEAPPVAFASGKRGGSVLFFTLGKATTSPPEDCNFQGHFLSTTNTRMKGPKTTTTMTINDCGEWVSPDGKELEWFLLSRKSTSYHGTDALVGRISGDEQKGVVRR